MYIWTLLAVLGAGAIFSIGSVNNKLLASDPVRIEEYSRTTSAPEYFGRAFLPVRPGSSWTLIEAGLGLWASPELSLPFPAEEAIVSWNAELPPGTGLEVFASAFVADRWSKRYCLGRWSPDNRAFIRQSVENQSDADGSVATDTLNLKRPTQRLRLYVRIAGMPPSQPPSLKYIGLAVMSHTISAPQREPNRAAWGAEVSVPSKTQLGWPDASGWCSPTSTAMALAYWSRKLGRPELDVSVPEAARACFDKVYDGTGNWPFNTAWAGSFRGMRAYVSRFGDIRELEDWAEQGLPVVVSLSYDLLLGIQRPNDPGHLMVCCGFTRDGDIVLNDPAHRPDKGQTARRVFPRANFLRAWERSRRTVYLVYPEGVKVPDNLYGHWDTDDSQ